MIEHRLIERMIAVMKSELQRLEDKRKVNPVLIDTAADFIRTYADRCHHGKEEDILFRELAKKQLSEAHRAIMQELIDEHTWGRKTTKKLVDSKERYLKREENALSEMVTCLRELVDFYPKHIEKEDRRFFVPVMAYFTQEEKEAMLQEGYEFDRNLIHEKYRDIVREFERE
jgi:hemerythrin-like domain-containing protein